MIQIYQIGYKVERYAASNIKKDILSSLYSNKTKEEVTKKQRKKKRIILKM